VTVSANPLARRSDLDWLRVIACYLLFPFHVGMVFSPAPFFHVRNAEVAVPFLVLCGFISLWHMPLFFLLSGWSAHGSLSLRGVRGFLAERWRKLGVPLVAGCVLFAPGIKYAELRGGQDLNRHGLRVAEELQPSFRSVIPEGLEVAPPFDETFLEFLPSFFTDPDRFTWSHLWFIAYLLTFSLVLLPLLAALRRGADAPGLRSPLWVYLPLLPLLAIQLTLRERFPGPYNLYSDWANVSYYATFLLAGFALARWPALERLVAGEWRRALGIAVAAALVLLGAVLGLVTSTPLVLVAAAVAGWCFVVAWLGAAQRRLAGPSRRLAYLAESAFPIYVLHQPVIVLLGVGVVALPVGAGAKFLLLLAGSIAATLAVYHFLVRPYTLPRFLLAMKPVAAEVAARPAPRAAATALGRS
jgi:peptidoglycan/LPS O-acetylase OafA/YrhL